jgi:hypothetical protein
MLGVARAETVRVVADGVQMYVNPDPRSRVLAIAARNLVLEVIGRVGPWVRVAMPETGYAAYVLASKTEPGGAAPPSAVQRLTATPSGEPAPAPARPTPAQAPPPEVRREPAPAAQPQPAPAAAPRPAPQRGDGG